MYICEVIGKVISTQKNSKLTGTSLVLVRPLSLADKDAPVPSDMVYTAADPIGCGEGNLVLVTCGSNARFACQDPQTPVDMAIVGIVDHMPGK